MARISVIIPDEIIEKLDDYSDDAGYTRSELLRYLIRKFFNKLEGREE